MSPENEDRYEDILKRIAERRPFGQKRRDILPQTPHERALDRINAFDCLSNLTRQPYDHWLCYGPKSLRGPAWAGVVVWAHRKGYHGYQQLTLHGVWAHYAEGDILLSMGTRHLPYSASIYDAGVYRVAIGTNFRIYYDDSGGPPADGDDLHFRGAFDDRDRLRQRQSLRQIVNQWRRNMAAG